MIYKQTEHHSFPVRVKLLFQRMKGFLLNKCFQGSSKLSDTISQLLDSQWKVVV